MVLATPRHASTPTHAGFSDDGGILLSSAAPLRDAQQDLGALGASRSISVDSGSSEPEFTLGTLAALRRASAVKPRRHSSTGSLLHDGSSSFPVGALTSLSEEGAPRAAGAPRARRASALVSLALDVDSIEREHAAGHTGTPAGDDVAAANAAAQFECRCVQ